MCSLLKLGLWALTLAGVVLLAWWLLPLLAVPLLLLLLVNKTYKRFGVIWFKLTCAALLTGLCAIFAAAYIFQPSTDDGMRFVAIIMVPSLWIAGLYGLAVDRIEDPKQTRKNS